MGSTRIIINKGDRWESAVKCVRGELIRMGFSIAWGAP